MDGDFVISSDILDLTKSPGQSLLDETNKITKEYRPDAGGLELLEKLWLACNRGFLLIFQLLRDFCRHVTVS